MRDLRYKGDETTEFCIDFAIDYPVTAQQLSTNNVRPKRREGLCEVKRKVTGKRSNSKVMDAVAYFYKKNMSTALLWETGREH